MKDFFQRIQQFRLLLSALFVATILLLWLGVKNVIQLGDFWINLAAGTVTLVGTLFVIDVILDRRRKTELREAHGTAKVDIAQLTNMLISYMASPFKITVFDYERGTQNIEVWSNEVLGHILEDIKKRDKLKLLSSLNKDGWEHFQLNLLFIKPSLSETLALYKELLPPEILGKILKVRRSFNNFYYSFGLLYIGFITDNKAIPTHLLEGLENDLSEYFLDVEHMLNTLKNWKNETL